MLEDLILTLQELCEPAKKLAEETSSVPAERESDGAAENDKDG